jgi:hypothetical protein
MAHTTLLQDAVSGRSLLAMLVAFGIGVGIAWALDADEAAANKAMLERLAAFAHRV